MLGEIARSARLPVVLAAALFLAGCPPAPPSPAPPPPPPPPPVVPTPTATPVIPSLIPVTVTPFTIFYPPGYTLPIAITLTSLAQDQDRDGLSDADEAARGTNPLNPDTDGDGLSDGEEVHRYGTNPLATDTDGDTLSDGDEVHRYGTSPADRDTDGDLIPDDVEVRGASRGLNPTQPNNVNNDTDGDGLSDIDEMRHRTDILNPDTDGDGVNDGDEVARGADPTDPSDHGVGPPPQDLVEIELTVGDPSGSVSERYNLDVGPISHQATRYGVVERAIYKFKRGKRYDAEVIHTGTDPAFLRQYGFSNYDWQADIQPVDPNECVWVEDPDHILTTYIGWPNSTFLIAGKKAWLNISKVDLDIDSDNSNGFGPPDRTDAEDAIEDAGAPYPGKVIAVNDGDADDDGVRDLDDDEIPGGHFVPIVLELVDPIDLTKAKVRFQFTNVRLWKKDAPGPRVRQDAAAGGDLVTAGVEYDPAALGLGRTITLYVEGTAAGPDSIEADVDPNGPADPPAFCCQDKVDASGVEIDLDVDTDRNKMVDDADEKGEDAWVKDRGALFMVNSDDDDGDAKLDAIDFLENGTPTAEDLKINGASDEKDVAPLIVRAVGKKDGVQFFLQMNKDDLKAVHVFEERKAGSVLLKAGAADWSGWAAAGAREDVEITSKVSETSDHDFGIEGLFFAGLPVPGTPAGYTFDGEVSVTLVAQATVGATRVEDSKVIGRDVVRLRVAPFLLLPNTQTGIETWLTSDAGANDIAAGIGATAKRAASAFPNHWVQDHVQIGFTAMPGAAHHVTMRMPYVDLAAHAIAQPNWPETNLRADERGLLRFFNTLLRGGTSAECGGNLEVAPPTTTWPLGRVAYGSTMRMEIPAFFDAQKLAGPDAPQKPFSVPVDWLRVGHIDEIVAFAPSGANWQIIAADPMLAQRTLSALPGWATFFAKGATDHGTATNTSALRSSSWVVDGVSHGSIICAAGVRDGDTVTIDDGTGPRVFEFDVAGGVQAGRVAVAISATSTASEIRDRLGVAIGSMGLNLWARGEDPATIVLLQKNFGALDRPMNATVSAAAIGAGFSVAGLSGGKPAGKDFTRTPPWKMVRIYSGKGAGRTGQIDASEKGWVHIAGHLRSERLVATSTADPGLYDVVKSGGFRPRLGPTLGIELDASSTYVVAEDSLRWAGGVPALHTVHEVVNEAELWNLNRAAKADIDRAVAAITAAMGGPAGTIPTTAVPVVFWGKWTSGGTLAGRNNEAFTPNLANFQPARPDRIVFPKEFGPSNASGTADALEDTVAGAVGAAARFADIWELFHLNSGGVHCATEARREPFSFDWWTKQP